MRSGLISDWNLHHPHVHHGSMSMPVGLNNPKIDDRSDDKTKPNKIYLSLYLVIEKTFLNTFYIYLVYTYILNMKNE